MRIFRLRRGRSGVGSRRTLPQEKARRFGAGATCCQAIGASEDAAYPRVGQRPWQLLRRRGNSSQSAGIRLARGCLPPRPEVSPW